MIKLAVFDIDRTLIPTETGVVAPETVAALKQLQAKGIKIAIASGRLYSFLQTELLDIGFDYYILSNGTCITDGTGKVLALENLVPERVEELVQELIRRDYPSNIRYSGGQRTGNPNCTVHERMQPIWEKRNMKPKPPKGMRVEYVPQPGEKPISCSAFIPEEEQEEFIRMFPDMEFLPVFESPLCDVNPAGVSKGSGLKLVCALMNITPEETVGFGDDWNDLDLIRTAGIGVAMENGIQALKDEADYIAPPSVDLGVVRALRHLGLIDEI